MTGGGDCSGVAANGAGVSNLGSLGVTGDPTGVEKGVGGGEVVSVSGSGNGTGVVGPGVDSAGSGAADMGGDGPGWGTVTGENFLRN